jgi:hypothetical protein
MRSAASSREPVNLSFTVTDRRLSVASFVWRSCWSLATDRRVVGNDARHRDHDALDAREFLVVRRTDLHAAITARVEQPAIIHDRVDVRALSALKRADGPRFGVTARDELKRDHAHDSPSMRAELLGAHARVFVVFRFSRSSCEPSHTGKPSATLKADFTGTHPEEPMIAVTLQQRSKTDMGRSRCSPGRPQDQAPR